MANRVSSNNMQTMNRYEVQKEISLEGFGRLPLWCHWYAKETEAKYGRDLEELKAEFPDDILMAEFLAGGEAKNATDPDGAIVPTADHPYWYGGMDEFGCFWRKSEDGVGAQIIGHPLKDIDGLEAYLENQFPIIGGETRDRFSSARDLRNRFPDSYIVGKLFRLFFERMHFIAGMSETFIYLYTERDRMVKLMQRLFDFIISLIDGWKDIDVDAVFIGDDWGFQNQMMINPDDWRQLFKPWYARLFTYMRSKNLQVWYHSCGNIEPIIPDLIEIGLHVLNPLQASALDPITRIAPKYRGLITFNGGFNSQDLAHYKSPAIVQHAVDSISTAFGTSSGGYIGGPDGTIMPEVSFEQIRWMCMAFRQVRQSKVILHATATLPKEGEH